MSKNVKVASRDRWRKDEKENAKREGGHFLIPEPESSGSLGLHDVPLGRDNIPPSGLAVNFGLCKRDISPIPAGNPARKSFAGRTGKPDFEGGGLAVKVASNWQTTNYFHPSFFVITH